MLENIKEDNFAQSSMPIQPVTLLLLDINMPLLNGFATLKKVK